ncbi:MAG: ABC transporter substrate-binding protein [Thermodesulfobacteriota bacterium]|nr:ABC transporter substrate-binding protein [Thermodesulfobacteriota bacterium]
MEKWKKGIFVLAMVFLFSVSSFTVAFGQEIKIGVAGPMAYVQGEHHWFGADMAQAEINAKGGILVGKTKRPIKLVKVDTNEILSVTDAASAVERTITRDKVDFIVGGFRTEAVLAMQDIAMDYKKIFLICGAAHPEMCRRVAKDYERFKYTFRVTPVNSTFLARISFLMTGMVGGMARKELGIPKPKVALLIEKAAWADPIAAAAEKTIPGMEMEIVGTWRPSATATEVTAELSAIKGAGAHMIYHILSGPVGVPYGKQWGELKIPAAATGINVEAQKKGFWEATRGMGNYQLTVNTLGRAEITAETIPWYDEFTKRAGEFPTYNAGTHAAIYILKEAIERAGTLEAGAVVLEMEKTDYVGPGGRYKFFPKDHEIAHDLIWGPGFVTATGTQWQDGELKVVWPPPGGVWEKVDYKGAVMYRLPPWVKEHWKK